MNGQFGFSSRVFDWNGALTQRAMENIALYKRIRTVIDGADVYHLTPQPKRNNPSGWMAIEYVGQDRRRSVVMAYRLGHSASTTTFTPRGLDPSRHYRVSQDGRDLLVATGRELCLVGISVKLDAEWRAAIIELEAQP
jgi:alpha-galactosidase